MILVCSLLAGSAVFAGSISGRVTRESNGDPLEGVRLYLYQGEDEFIADDHAWDWVNSADANPVYTDANGEYQFTGLAERRYRIRFEDQEVAGTHYFAANLYNVQAFAGANTPNMDIVLRQAGLIYGYVQTAAGDPIPYAELIAVAPWTHYGEGWHWTSTDVNGRYEFWVAPSPGKFYPIWVRSGYLNDVSYECKWDQTFHQATISGTLGPDYYLDPAGAVTGRVINESGVGIEGVWIENDRWNKYMTDGPWTETGSDGTFLLDGLPTGTNYVYLSNNWREIEQDGVKYMVGEAYAGPINIVAGETVDVGDFVIYQAGMVTGIVTDEAGFPVVAAEVELEGKDIDGNWADRDEIITDAFGQFTIDYVAPGTYALDIEKGGFIATKETGITVDRGGHIDVDVVLRSDAEGAAVSGSITDYAQIAGKDPDGVPLPFYDDSDYDEYGIPEFGILALSMSRDYTESDYLDIDNLFIGDMDDEDIDDGYGDYFEPDLSETPGNYVMHLPPGDTALVMYIWQDYLPGWGGCAILYDWKRFNLSKGDVRSNVNFTVVTTNTGTLRGNIVAPGYNYYPEDWCSIYAHALDENNNVKSPVLGDAIAMAGWTTTYEFRNLPAGKYMLKAYARNLAGVIVESVTVDADGTTNQDIVFTSGGTLTGRITDGADGVSGAVVGIRENGMQTTTDDSGNYTIAGIGKGDSYTVTVSASGYADAQSTVSIVAGSTTTKDFALSRAVGTISGTVKDLQGNDINGAEVVAYNETDKTHLMVTTVGGSFSIPDLTYGEYILAVQTALHGVLVYPSDDSRLTLSASQDDLGGIGIVLGAFEPPEFSVSSTVETEQGVTTLSIEFYSDINLAAEPVISVLPGTGNGVLGPLTSNTALNRFEIDYTVDDSDTIVLIRIEEAGGNPAGKTFTFEVGGDLVQTSSTNVTNAMGGETRIMGTQDDTRVYVPPFAVAGADETEALTLTVERYGDPGDAVEGAADTSVSAVYDFHFDEDGVSIRQNHTFTITMSFQLPEGMSTDEFEDTLQIRYFDAAAHAWATDGISNVRINWANSTIMFDVSHLSKFAAFIETEPRDGIITIAKCSVKAGKSKKGTPARGLPGFVGKDSISFAGIMDITKDELETAAHIYITIVSDVDGLVACDESLTINRGKVKKGKYRHRDKQKGISFKIDTKKGKFALKIKNANLTGLGCPLTVEIEIGNYYGIGSAGEAVVNGKKKPIPIQLMSGYKDTLPPPLKIKAKKGKKPSTDSFSVKGGFSLKDEPSPITSMTLFLGDQAFDLTDGAGAFTYKKDKKTSKIKTIAYKTDKGVIPQIKAKFDFVKCRYSVSIKKAELQKTSGQVDFGIDIDMTTGSFNESVAVDLD